MGGPDHPAGTQSESDAGGDVMARSTGPILAVGAVTIANRVLFNSREMDWRIPIATGAAAMFFAMAEKPLPDVVPALAWLTLATVMLTRIDPAVPSPAESFVTWWEGQQR